MRKGRCVDLFTIHETTTENPCGTLRLYYGCTAVVLRLYYGCTTVVLQLYDGCTTVVLYYAAIVLQTCMLTTHCVDLYSAVLTYTSWLLWSGC